MMKRRIANLFLLSLLVLFFSSCGANCEQIEVKKVEWVTRYENYTVDTLVSYTMSDFVKLVNWSGNSIKRNKHTHSVTVKNTNESYANRFAVEFQVQYSYDNTGNWTHTTEYVEIPANAEYTFNYEWNGARGNFDSDFKVTISVLQQSTRITLKKRIDELITSSIMIDNCSGNPDAEQAKYDAIKSLYDRQLNEGLIKIK